MRRFRNPGYAPESLERRLSPSGAVARPVAALVHVPNTQADRPIVVVPARPTVPPPAGLVSTNPAHRPTFGHALTLDDPAPTGPSTPVPTGPAPTGGTEPGSPGGGGPDILPSGSGGSGGSGGPGTSGGH